MSIKKRMSQVNKKSSSSMTGTGSSVWSRSRRVVVSVLVALHLMAVFVAPWSAPPPSSDLARTVAGWFAPYLHLAYLNHGYRFFAPDPGPSHLVRYELEMPDGSIKTGRFPDVGEHWPRLLYHRHFMISESVFNITQPFVESPPGGFVNAAQREAFETEKQRSSIIVRSLARYMIQQHGARRVRLFVQTHHIPAPWDLESGMQLDDQRLYQERPLGEFAGDEL